MNTIWNNRLEIAGFTIRVDQYSQKYTILSNGIVLDTPNKVGQFKRRLASGWNMDLAYHTDIAISKEYIKQHKSQLAKVGGIICQKKNPQIRKIAKENLRKARESGKNQEWHKEKDPWNKGLTKETDTRLMKYSQQKTGEGNPMFGYSPTEEERQRASDKMKENIKTGKFTPNIRNSGTHWQVEYKGKKFRSSWEAAWFALNPTYEYETVRISYWLDGKEKIYIVDFYDPITNTLIEVKPVEHTYDEKFKAKKVWAEKWAAENSGQYLVITQKYLKENMYALLASDLPEDVKEKIRGIK